MPTQSAGSGKTMLMDLFFDSLPVPKKRRVHFHTFMIELHQRLHAWYQAHQKAAKAWDPMVDIAYEFAEEATVLYIDEFQVPLIAILVGPRAYLLWSQLNDPVDVTLLTRLLVPLATQYG